MTRVLYALGRWCAAHAVLVLVLWLALLGGARLADRVLPPPALDPFVLAGTDSAAAQTLLNRAFPGAASEPVPLVMTDEGDLTTEVGAGTVAAVAEAVAGVTGVNGVRGPEEQPDLASADGRTVILQLTMAERAAADKVVGEEVLTTARQAAEEASPTARVALGGYLGQQISRTDTRPSEALGLALAVLVLLFTLRRGWPVVIPLATAVVAVGIGLAVISLLGRLVYIPDEAPTLGTMLGLGVGIDYALFITNRFRQSMLAGHDARSAALEAVRTSGRAVAFAGTAVIIALMGLLVLGISFFYGLALAAAATVLMMMVSALWFLPALLGLLGDRALGWRMPWARGKKEWHPEGGGFAHYGRLLQRRPLLPLLGALAVVLLVASPVLSMRLGFSDDGGRPEGSSLRTGYDLLAEGFGPGVNGPFFVAVSLFEQGDTEAVAATVTALEQTEGVAGTLPTAAMLPLTVQPSDTVAAIQVIPDSAPQDEETTQLLDRIRTETLPAVDEVTGAQSFVGGFQAVTSDFTDVLADAMPVFLAVVVGLGFLALVILFRSVVVPLTGAVTSLLSLAAALGITTAVFQWGWFAPLIGVESTGPIFPFLPVMVFAILFGLSMDYQVFLVSRMQEEWVRTQDNRTAVRRGLAGSGRVVLIAALIMASVFLAFVPSPTAEIKLFGVALGSAVLIDAFVVRLVLVPSLMTLLGRANWWLPSWLSRLLPEVSVEGGEDEIADDPDLEGEPELAPSR